MCVLASAVDIDHLTHREAVTGYPAGHRFASFCAVFFSIVGIVPREVILFNFI